MDRDYESVQIATPAVTMETVGKVTRGLFSFKKRATYKDLAKLVGLHEITVSKGFSAARDLGLMETTGGRGVYILTSVGENFARLLDFGKEVDCRTLIAKQIIELENWSEIVTFLEINRGIPKNPLDLVLHVEGRLGKRWKSRMRTKIARSYRSILEYAGLIEIDDGNIISILSMGGESELLGPSDGQEPAKSPTETGTYSSSISNVRMLTDYAEFGIPDFFVVFVKKTPSAVDFFRKQIANSSLFVAWLDTLQNELEKKSLEENFDNEEGD